jgi:hypothetical protein
MSHVTQIDVEIKDLKALADAARELGGELVEASTYKWYGTWVGDYPMPKGINTSDLGRCQYKIVFPNTEYEVGFLKQDDKFAALFDFWVPVKDHGKGRVPLIKRIGENGGLLSQQYTIAKATRDAKARGLRTTKKVHENGTIELRIGGIV